MHRDKGCASVLQLPHGQRHGFGDIKELQIDHDLISTVQNHINDRKPAGQKELQANFVEFDAIAQPIQPAGRLIGRINVKRKDLSLIHI